MDSEPTKIALMVVDVQYDFLPPTGALPVPGGCDILPVINRLLDHNLNWSLVVASADSHPYNHISFASSHGLKPFNQLKLSNSKVIDLWPDHCIRGTKGSEIEFGVQRALDKFLELELDVVVYKKGEDINKEEYSAFRDKGIDGLTEQLKYYGINNLVIVGLASEYCVYATAKSALERGFRVYWVKDGTAAVGGLKAQNEVEQRLLKDYGVDAFRLVDLETILSILKKVPDPNDFYCSNFVL
ncbi:Isochorismatase-like protein [Phakopsora pachyrhizi]|uniref:nicotinamidase n=1 Tax=Phakopsora pachyrhizi TaxID=170000 RepID=A0AAV0BGZ1_PHAPC|nr:Isochorismatase-like protein [Phakopsora pachyrhizi]CAH7686584.1 Isochorismatase-like protein [Phakopsora pachyrhizi]